MAYDEKLAQRVRESLRGQQGVEEKKMMGGLTFMVNGKMCVGIVKDELMARVDPGIHDELVKRKGCRTMDFTKKPMKGFVFIDERGTGSKKELESWIGLALEYNSRAKASKKKKKA